MLERASALRRRLAAREASMLPALECRIASHQYCGPELRVVAAFLTVLTMCRIFPFFSGLLTGTSYNDIDCHGSMLYADSVVIQYMPDQTPVNTAGRNDFGLLHLTDSFDNPVDGTLSKLAIRTTVACWSSFCSPRLACSVLVGTTERPPYTNFSSCNPTVFRQSVGKQSTLNASVNTDMPFGVAESY